MISTIDLQAFPNQKLSVLLNDQECDIALRQLGNRLYCTLTVEDETLFENALCTLAAPIGGSETLGFDGVLFFLDTKGKESPQWEGLGTRWILNYASSDEEIYESLINARAIHD
nr:MAG TPA: hypothetical protein [Caudoviricetes sp.]